MDRIGGPSPQIGRKRWDQANDIAKMQISQWRRGETIDMEVAGNEAGNAGTGHDTR